MLLKVGRHGCGYAWQICHCYCMILHYVQKQYGGGGEGAVVCIVILKGYHLAHLSNVQAPQFFSKLQCFKHWNVGEGGEVQINSIETCTSSGI